MLKTCYEKCCAKIKRSPWETTILLLFGSAVALDTLACHTYGGTTSPLVPAWLSALTILGVLISALSPMCGGALLSCLLLLGALLNANFGVLSISGYVLAATWISRGWLAPALILPVLVDGTTVAISSDPSAFVALACGMSLAIPTGLCLQSRFENAKLSDAQLLSISFSERQKIIAEVKTELHNTVARDLVRLALLAQNLPYHSDVAQKSQQMHQLITESLDAVRTLMDGLAIDSAADVPTVVSKYRTMLADRDIHLSCNVSTSALTNADERTRGLLGLGISEGCLNIFKHAASNSVASLSVETMQDGAFSLIVTNQMPRKEQAEPIGPGGYGLINLTHESRLIGGDTYTWHTDDQWILAVRSSSQIPIKTTQGGPVGYTEPD